MTIHKAKWLLVGLVCLALWPALVLAQAGQWESYRDAGIEAFLDGDYAEAEEHFAAAIRAAEELGLDDPRLAESLNGLGEVNRAQGKFTEAERMHKRALAIREKGLGPDHADVAQSLNNLAKVYQAQGKSAEVEALRNRAILIEERVAALANLWESYMAAGKASYQQGRYVEAELQWSDSLTVAEGFGPQDPRLAKSLNNLAGLYKALGGYAEAEPLAKRALAILEKTLGPERPEVAAATENLAMVYLAQGRYAEAEPLQKRALTIREKVLGPEHPLVARSLDNLALVYKAQGRYAEAEPLAKRALAIVEKAWGPKHPNLPQFLDNYAALLRETGRSAEAAEMEARASATRARHTRNN